MSQAKAPGAKQNLLQLTVCFHWRIYLNGSNQLLTSVRPKSFWELA